ncbi:MAG: hypothetical protein ACI84O_001222 [Myxococcota bacterium]|jgi:uncharacterized protein (TIGR02231 family)
MKNLKVISLFSVLFCTSSLYAVQQDLALESKIERVTVYPGFALVERLIDIPAQTETGDFSIAISPLPWAAEPTSFQTEALDGALVVQGLDLRSRMSTVANTAKAGALGEQLATLQQQMIDAVAAQEGIKLQTAALKNIAADTNQPSNDVWKSPDSVVQRLAFLGRKMAEFDKALQDNQAVIDDLQEQIDDLNLQINGALHDGGKLIREVRLNCFAQALEPSQIRLSYLVAGPSWQPAYDVRIAPDLTGVNVNLIGQVSQRTGEDWHGVSLILSTSMPQIGLDPPAVPQRIVSQDNQLLQLQALGYADDDSFSEGSEDKRGNLQRKAVDFDLELEESEVAPTAEVIDFGITTQFVMPGKVDVSNNGEAHRFAIRSVPLAVSPERYVVPSQSSNAYLRAEVKHTGDSVLLAGKAKIFLGPDYLGESSFPLMRQDDTTTLNLGIDPNLEVTYDILEDYRDDPGSFSLLSTSTITRRYSAKLRLSPSAHGKITVVVEDALPQSNSDAVEVEVGELFPEAVATEQALLNREEKGLYRWAFVLHPGESKVVRWGYELSFDEDLAPRVRQQ